MPKASEAEMQIPLRRLHHKTNFYWCEKCLLIHKEPANLSNDL